MSGRTFGYQGGFDDFVTKLLPDIQLSERRKAVGIGDNLLREVEEFINRFCVTATNDDGDVIFDAAGAYTFQGAVDITGTLNVTGASTLTDATLTGEVNATTGTLTDLTIDGNLDVLGGAIRTATSGRRIEITDGTFNLAGDDYSSLFFYSGNSDEVNPGYVGVGESEVGGIDFGYLYLQAPDFGDESPYIWLTGSDGEFGTTGRVLIHNGGNSEFDMNGSGADLTVNGNRALTVKDTGYVWADQGRLYLGDNSTVLDDYIFGNGSRYSFYIDSTEDARISNAGDFYANRYIQSNSRRFYFGGSMGTLANDYLIHDDGSHHYTFVEDGSGFFRIQRTSTHTSYSGGGSRVMSTQFDGDGLIEWYLPTRNAAGDAIMAWATGLGSAPNTVAIMRADGDMENDNGSYGTLSDERTKANIAPLVGHREVLVGTMPYSFTKVKKANEFGELFDRDPVDTYGYVAQRSHESIVFQSGGDLLGVAENRMVPWLHAGWREHDDRIARLEAALLD